MLSRLDRVWSANREVGHGLAITDPWAAFHLGAFLQVVMNHGHACASDNAMPPRIIALPFDDGFNVHGFAWKDRNDGQSFVVVKQKSAKALMSLIDPHQDSTYEQTLFCFSDGR